MTKLEKGTFYRSYYEAGKFMPDHLKLQYYEKVFSYLFDGEETKCEGIVEAVFQAIRPNIKCSRDRAIVGAIGGSKSKNFGNQNASKNKAKTKQKQSNVKDNDKENIELNIKDNTIINSKLDNELFFNNIETNIDSVILDLNISEEYHEQAKQELFKFWNYWTEKDMRGKEKWRGQKTFEVRRRLTTWFINSKQFTSNNFSYEKKGRIAG